jgi:hypothetical protein
MLKSTSKSRDKVLVRSIKLSSPLLVLLRELKMYLPCIEKRTKSIQILYTGPDLDHPIYSFANTHSVTKKSSDLFNQHLSPSTLGVMVVTTAECYYSPLLQDLFGLYDTSRKLVGTV